MPRWQHRPAARRRPAEADFLAPLRVVDAGAVEGVAELDEHLSDISRPKVFSGRASSIRVSTTMRAPPSGRAT